MGITNDFFVRTTQEKHKKVVQEILQELWDAGEIYRDEYEGWYDVSSETFYTEKDVVDGLSPEGKPVERIRETAYYFKMSKYQDWLIQYINDNPNFIQPDFRKNETLGFLRQPLGDLCISRPKSRMSWGIELPFDADFVCYVWFDALVNYISSVGYRRDDAEFKKWWPASYHLIGKDILTTHTVYWPTMLKAMNVELPQTIFAHGWWLMENAKMSKSDGNVVNPMDLCDKYGVDSFRYFLIAEMNLGQDSNFSEDAFIERYNTDLAGNLGNMLSRVVKMIIPHFDGQIPTPGGLQAEDEELKIAVLAAVNAMEQSIYDMKMNKGLEQVINAIKACNRYFEQTKPWALAKEGNKERLATVMYTAAEALRIISGLLFPVIPEKMTVLRGAIGVPANEISPDLSGLKIWGIIKPGAVVTAPDSLFPRIDKPKPKQPKQQKKKNKPENVVELIEISDFFKAKLKVAAVTEAESVEGADRLLKLQVEVGGDLRQIVAGIAEYYAPADILGKRIVIVSNLKPTTIRGVESHGMLLAAKKGKKLTLITTDDPEFKTGVDVG